jgi:hypothetical protein
MIFEERNPIMKVPEVCFDKCMVRSKLVTDKMFEYTVRYKMKRDVNSMVEHIGFKISDYVCQRSNGNFFENDLNFNLDLES